MAKRARRRRIDVDPAKPVRSEAVAPAAVEMRSLPVLPTHDTLRSVQAAQAAQTQAVDELGRVVELARAEGHTWKHIGQALGISAQAAQQRFGRS